MNRLRKWWNNETVPTPLSSQELLPVGELLTDVVQLHADYGGLDGILALCRDINPLTMYTTGQNGLITDSIFKGGFGPILLSITSRFFMVSGGGDFTHRLALTLVEGLCLDGPNPDHSTLPEQIRNCMPLHACRENSGDGDVGNADIAKHLVSNKHLIIVLLLHIFNVAMPQKENHD